MNLNFPELFFTDLLKQEFATRQIPGTAYDLHAAKFVKIESIIHSTCLLSG